MTLVRVDPTSIRRYEVDAQALFDGMHAALSSVVGEVAGVRYFGPNATAFKRDATLLATEFASRLQLEMQAIAEVVRVATSNIASALGGLPISVVIHPRPLATPALIAVEYVDVDTAALESLSSRLVQHFESLRGGLTTHLGALTATDWEGRAKHSTVEAVTRFTASARAHCDEGQRTLTAFVHQQLSLVLNADR